MNWKKMDLPNCIYADRNWITARTSAPRKIRNTMLIMNVSILCWVLTPTAILTANTLATTIQIVPKARAISDTTGLGVNMKMNNKPGDQEKKKGRASCE